MTATTVLSHQYVAAGARRARPHGIDRLVMRLSLAMLMWARHRADRAQPTHEDQLLRRNTALAVEHDRREAQARIARVF